jgi:hypothetical protein
MLYNTVCTKYVRDKKKFATCFAVSLMTYSQHFVKLNFDILGNLNFTSLIGRGNINEENSYL